MGERAGRGGAGGGGASSTPQTGLAPSLRAAPPRAAVHRCCTTSSARRSTAAAPTTSTTRGRASTGASQARGTGATSSQESRTFRSSSSRASRALTASSTAERGRGGRVLPSLSTAGHGCRGNQNGASLHAILTTDQTKPKAKSEPSWAAPLCGKICLRTAEREAGARGAGLWGRPVQVPRNRAGCEQANSNSNSN